MRDNDPYSKKRYRTYEWFFTEYNHQWINYKKFYLASSAYKKRAKYLNYGIGVTGSAVVVIILAIVKGIQPELLTPFALGASLLVGLLSATDSVGDYERKYVRYYRIGQRFDDLYTEMDYLVKVRLPDPDEDDEELAKRCRELVDRKDDLNGSAPQISEKWYRKLQEEERDEGAEDEGDPLKWDRPDLNKLR